MPADEELMRRIADRDMAAFDAMFARHAEPIRRRLARLIRDRAAVEDLVQEVFLRLWTRADQWDGRGEPAAWLGRIATNLALNHLRSGKRRVERLEPP
ncbi:MAG: RNA polymerase sigma factor, partial [Planctomycetota bacterium]